MRFCVFFMGICCGELMLSTFYLFHRKFFLIFFSHADRFYYLPFRDLMVFWKRMEDGGRKSFRREELKEELRKELLDETRAEVVKLLGQYAAGSREK